MSETIDKKTLENIAKHGLTIWHVMGEGEYSPFSYSVGLYKTYNHPEIIIIGLKQELTQVLINNVAEDIKNGKRYKSSSWSPDILEGFECYFTYVNKSNYDEYVGRALVFYGDDSFPLLQCIYPTVKGVYPWEKKWPEEIKNLQPVLGDLKLGI
jgi:hypothetical protein